MKIGDKVRFLNEEGGGKITGFRGKNIVVVEDKDGFDIPVQVSDVIVVQSDDYNISKVVGTKTESGINKETKGNESGAVSSEDDESDDPSDGDITYHEPVIERDGGDKLSVYLAFVPTDIKDFSSTRYECYIVNDSNYYISYSYIIAEGSTWTLRSQSEVEPNTKFLIEEFGQDDLNTFGHVAIQLIAYKRDKGFMLKEPLSVQFRIEPIKFYKLHVFVDNDFFETPAMLYTVVENDVPTKQYVVDAKKIKNEMYSANGDSVIGKDNLNVAKSADEYVRRYDDVKHKGNPFIIKHREYDNIIVVDLHADQLLDSVAGMNNANILDYQMNKFREVMNANIKNRGQKIVFIHGKGEGVLRHSIISDLSFRYKKCHYQDASFQEYGYGATQVTIH